MAEDADTRDLPAGAAPPAPLAGAPVVPAKPPANAPSEDDRRAAAAAQNRKRALDDWEAKKRLWRETGIPQGLPAKK